MSRKRNLLDQIIIVDLEATCWEGSPPSGEWAEIIEIGVCTLDIATGERREKESILVKPQHSRVSEYCTHLTTLTQSMLENGLTLAEACQHLQTHYNSRRRVWASYGDYDRKMLVRQCEEMDIPYPFGDTHVNIKNLLAISLGLPKEVGLDRGLAYLNMPMVGTHHRGVDDAWNMAGILALILLNARKGISEMMGNISSAGDS
jgi:inhibitor of KinA sporulation pathway (predicted exonuclease)